MPELKPCPSCIHNVVCADCDENTLVCSQYMNENEYRKSSEVAVVAIDRFRDAIMDVFIDMCRGNDYNKVTLLQIGDAIDAVYDKQIAELYESEGADDD